MEVGRIQASVISKTALSSLRYIRYEKRMYLVKIYYWIAFSNNSGHTFSSIPKPVNEAQAEEGSNLPEQTSKSEFQFKKD